MKNHVEYLLKYISNDAYQNLLKKKGYQIEVLKAIKRYAALKIKQLRIFYHKLFILLLHWSQSYIDTMDKNLS